MSKDTESLAITAINGGTYQIGQTIFQRVGGVTESARVIGVATEEDFPNVNTHLARYPKLEDER